MKKYTLGLMAFGLALAALIVVPAWAHHSFDVDFDTGNTADLAGIVTKVDWVNPHAFVFINTEDENGETANYSIELGPPLCAGAWWLAASDSQDRRSDHDGKRFACTGRQRQGRSDASVRAGAGRRSANGIAVTALRRQGDS